MFYDECDLKSIIFSDESKFNLFYSDGKVSVRRETGSGLKIYNITPTVKHGGGSIILWGCFSYYGFGKLIFIDGKIDSTKNVNILAQNIRDSARSMNINDSIFQQDHDPKHTSKPTKEYFRRNNINVLPWAPQSPDLNPIETL
ncbi:Transposable element Tcb2 transposase [Dictyocoela muelleri]|nr:Transposable element Tcb2 transposase [Dictyocoela muelleri]